MFSSLPSSLFRRDEEGQEEEGRGEEREKGGHKKESRLERQDTFVLNSPNMPRKSSPRTKVRLLLRGLVSLGGTGPQKLKNIVISQTLRKMVFNQLMLILGLGWSVCMYVSKYVTRSSFHLYFLNNALKLEQTLHEY